MPSETTITTRKEGPVLWIALERPEVMNAYNALMGQELCEAFDRADQDDAVRVIVLTGTGRVFCAGADISGGAQSFDTTAGSGAGNFGTADDPGEAPDFIGAMYRCRKPSIVAFNGSAVGVGLTMTLAADIRISAANAKFGFVFARRGLVPEAGAAWFLPKLVGMGQALQWSLTGRIFSAQEAADKGLVSEVCEAEELAERAREIAHEIAANCAPVSVALTRQLFWRFAAAPSPFEVMEVDGQLALERGSSPDVHEGVAAFLEKRSPSFPGKVSTDMPPSYPWWDD